MGIVSLELLRAPEGYALLPTAPVRGEEARREQDKKVIRTPDRILDLFNELFAALLRILPVKDLMITVDEQPGNRAGRFAILLGVAQKEHDPSPPCTMCQSFRQPQSVRLARISKDRKD